MCCIFLENMWCHYAYLKQEKKIVKDKLSDLNWFIMCMLKFSIFSKLEMKQNNVFTVIFLVKSHLLLCPHHLQGSHIVNILFTLRSLCFI